MEERKMKTRFCHNIDLPQWGESLTREQWLTDIEDAFKEVPEEYRDLAKLAVNEDDGYVRWGLIYQSPETDEEMDGTRKRLQMIEMQEKEQLRKLMEKYPDDSTTRRV